MSIGRHADDCAALFDHLDGRSYVAELARLFRSAEIAASKAVMVIMVR